MDNYWGSVIKTGFGLGVIEWIYELKYLLYCNVF